MPTITQQSPHVAPPDTTGSEPAQPVSEMIDATEVLYRLTVREFEQIAGILDDDRVELIDGFMVKKMVKNPPHVIACRRADAAIARIAPAGWHTRAGDPIQIDERTEPEPDVALVRGVVDDYENRHPGPNDIAVVVEVADTSLLKDRRRRRTYGPAGIGVYWIVNLSSRKIEVYTQPSSDGYESRVDYASGEQISVVVDGTEIGTVAVADIFP
jgi:Uma2 family endonuclease